ncbi:U-box domain-containing protein 4 [Capsicum galapagoense]
MVSLENSHSHTHHTHVSSSTTTTATAHYTQTRPYYYTPKHHHRPIGRSMRTIRSTFYQPDNSGPVYESDSIVDFRLTELAEKPAPVHETGPGPVYLDFLELSQTFSDFSACSSDISGELERLAQIPGPGQPDPEPELPNPEPEIVEIVEPEDIESTVKLCVDWLRSPLVAVKRSAAEKLRIFAKNRADNRALIGELGAIPALLPLLRCPDPCTQEHAVTGLLNLSLHEPNKALIANSGAIKSLIYVLKTGTETSKQNAACALLSLALIDENKLSIGACGGVPPLVMLLINGTNRGKKDALTTLYKLCTVRLNKERAVNAGVVKPLVGLVCEEGMGLAEKAMVVLSSLTGVEMGKESIVEEGGIGALVEMIEDGSDKGKEFAVMTLLQLCVDSVRNRGLLVREGGIPPLVALSQTGTAKAKHKAETLLAYLREPRQEASTSTP